MAKGDQRRAKTTPRSVPPRRARTTHAATSTQSDHPFFCFRYVDRATRNEWRFPGGDAHEIISFLQDIAGLTWGQIESQMTGRKKRHKKHHGQPIESLEPLAQEDIRRMRYDETFGDEMFRFRLGGEKRLWGFRDGRVFHVVWWDTRHGVKRVEKRHT